MKWKGCASSQDGWRCGCDAHAYLGKLHVIPSIALLRVSAIPFVCQTSFEHTNSLLIADDAEVVVLRPNISVVLGTFRCWQTLYRITCKAATNVASHRRN